MKKTLILLTLILNFNFVLAGSIFNVPSQYSTIQEAINVSSSGDTVLVESGTYYESNLSFDGKEIILLSESGSENTIIDGQNNQRIFDIKNGETFNTEVNGFTLQNGGDSYGAAIRIIDSSRLTVKNSIITSTSSSGPWTYAVVTVGRAYNNGPRSAAAINMINCELSNNEAYYGGAVFNEGNGDESWQSTFDNCRFINNTD